ncbi:putative antirepressor - phage associated [Paenibacillus sp. HMSSN-139]|nr:putative antirepressor - phage associated [Paenibacillus sp. HMSSN-139]
MNQLQVFNFYNQQVRTVEKDGQPWFALNDVCKVLEIGNPSDVKARLDDGVVSIEGIPDALNRIQQTLIVNEDGLFDVILESRKPEAKAFRKWITSEVLPTIRKTGGYVANDDMFIETYMPHADEGTKLMFRATLENVRRANERIRVMQPKADYFDALVERNLLTNFRDTAKELQIGERKFIGWLLENSYLYRDAKGKLKPYARYVPSLFELKEWERNGKADNQTLVTPKGRETFRLLLASATAV